ncbi:hypothetical protein PACTADRAFT_49853 [Pachysolen tannophilus NRRL Y-2460]|uniref:N-acetyltransferase domain-containing protein n=1 Tax=Pachysolen tannophilus NRRL Y-2460 TaxID=669874 RepID=A0A1E4TTN2_PACTA|nr:hypothetical protein PACTADRAFT_49853 [Pachysolen tannophilus NRRL Y-2460]
MTCAEYVLERTTDARVYAWCHLQNSCSWKSNLTSEQYVKRESVLSLTKICNAQRNENELKGIHYWVLRDMGIVKNEGVKNDDEVYDLTYNIVASSETLFRESWVFQFKDGIVDRKQVLSPCIGGVYTLPSQRGKGVASIMITKLNEKLSEMMDKDRFITLYSEIGNYYEKFGYKNFEVGLCHIPILDEDLNININIDENFSFNFLKNGEFKQIIEFYKKKFLKQIESLVLLDKNRTKISLIPSIEVIEWHHERSIFISKTLYDVKPGHFGVQICDNQQNLKGFIIWTHDYKEKSLVLLIIYGENLNILTDLIKLTILEAKKINFEKIICWESDLFNYKLNINGIDKDETSKFTKIIETDLHGKLHLKNGSISAALKFHNNVNDNGNLDWEGNGKWAWF